MSREEGNRLRLVHESRRERKKRFGELVQMDGSHHDWLEVRGERPVLIGMIDDATNEVIARFFPGESMRALMQTLRLWLETHGRPRAIYADRHSLWVSRAGTPGERDEAVDCAAKLKGRIELDEGGWPEQPTPQFLVHQLSDPRVLDLDEAPEVRGVVIHEPVAKLKYVHSFLP